MRRTFLQACLIFVLFALPVAFFFWRQAASEEAEPRPGPSVGERPSAVVERELTEGEKTPSPASAPAEPIEEEWGRALDEARSSRDPMGGLRAIADELQALDPAQAARRILGFLRFGADRETGLPWILGDGGALQSAPTLRLWLLDWLGRLEPVAAAEWAREALRETSGSADEFALNLRNFAWGSADEPAAIRSFLIDRAVALLNHEAWREAPSRGFQEAFDVLVWAEAGEAAGLLVEMAGAGQPEALRHPARLALERLVDRAPEATLAALLDDPRALEGAPRLRAGYLARADLGERAQRASVETYLLDPAISVSERTAFLRLVPNVNHAFSHNLLSENAVLSHAATVDRFRSAATALEDWLSDPRFASINEALLAARSRVGEVLASPFATGGPGE